jgi:hypothetical protein
LEYIEVDGFDYQHDAHSHNGSNHASTSKKPARSAEEKGRHRLRSQKK